MDQVEVTEQHEISSAAVGGAAADPNRGAVGYILVGLLLVVDVFRWMSIYLEYREDRRRNWLNVEPRPR